MCQSTPRKYASKMSKLLFWPRRVSSSEPLLDLHLLVRAADALVTLFHDRIQLELVENKPCSSESKEARIKTKIVRGFASAN